MKIVKSVTISVAIVTFTIVILSVGLVYGFTEFIYRTKSCDFLNIDNIELRAQIDIPKITYCDCSYDKTQDTKKVIFDMDTTKVNLSRYISRYGFSKLNSENELLLDDFLSFKKESDDFTNLSNFYYRQDIFNGNDYRMLLNNQSGRLWIFLKYAK